jgi:UDP-3-O-[3-hydroxymyristoyl] glucosamine N-acyltransferase
LVAVAATGEAFLPSAMKLVESAEIDQSATLRSFTLHSATKEQNAISPTSEGNVMLQKLSIAAVVASILFIPASAFAAPVHRHAHVNQSSHVNRSAHINRSAHVNRRAHVNRSAHINRSAHVNRRAHVNRNAHINRSAHVNRNAHVNRAVHGHYVVGRAYNGHYWYGHNRHRWNGRWYAYGAGPCWININSLWFWNVAVCPI